MRPVEVAGLVKRYAGRAVVDGVTLAIEPGEIRGFVGANGSGKTTSLRILAGLIAPDEGGGTVLGRDLRRDADGIRGRIGYMAQRLSLYGELSVYENLRFRADIYGLAKPATAAWAAAEEFDLAPFARRRADRLSGGWARRLQLAATLIHRPSLVLLDEPTAGLDALARQEVWRRIGTLAAQGAAVVVSTHDLAEAERCTRVSCFRAGRVVADGAPDAVAASAPALAFLLTGAGAPAAATRIEALAGVIAAYPQGGSLRVVTAPDHGPALADVAAEAGLVLAAAPVTLEDAALALARVESPP